MGAFVPEIIRTSLGPDIPALTVRQLVLDLYGRVRQITGAIGSGNAGKGSLKNAARAVACKLKPATDE